MTAMKLQPRTRAFVKDLRSVGGDIAEWNDYNVTMPRLMDEFVASIETWSVGPFNDQEPDGGGAWELNLELYQVDHEEALQLGWLIDALLRDVTGWEAKRLKKRLRVQIFGEPPQRSLDKPERYELVVYDGDDRDASLAVVYAAHFAEFARFVDSLAEIDETAGRAIRRAGKRLDTVPTIGFDVRGYQFEMSRIPSN